MSSPRPRRRPGRVTWGRLLVAACGFEILLIAILCNAAWEMFHG